MLGLQALQYVQVLIWFEFIADWSDVSRIRQFGVWTRDWLPGVFLSWESSYDSWGKSWSLGLQNIFILPIAASLWKKLSTLVNVWYSPPPTVHAHLKVDQNVLNHHGCFPSWDASFLSYLQVKTSVLKVELCNEHSNGCTGQAMSPSSGFLKLPKNSTEDQASTYFLHIPYCWWGTSIKSWVAHTTWDYLALHKLGHVHIWGGNFGLPFRKRRSMTFYVVCAVCSS